MNYFEINRELWNKKTPIHLASDFYDNDSFVNGRCSLNQPELDLLGNIEDKKILHLQCHFGQDTISLSRLGAKAVGVDLSDKAIEEARKLTITTKQNTRYINCNVYEIDKHIDEKFDIIFTSYGTIGWLPDLDKYFELVNQFLKPNGKFIIVDFHPFLWMWDYKFEFIEHSYFNLNPIIEESEFSYTDGDSHSKNKEIGWNHSFDEIFKSIKSNSMIVNDFKEYDFSPYDCFNNTIKVENGFQIKGWEGKVPMLYSLVVKKTTTA